jgi:hypothetical protein
MDGDVAAGASDCCGGPDACVFTKALLAQQAHCGLAQRGAVGERELVRCGAVVARMNCETLAALLRERATFALHLPRSGAPLEHARALRLQCGGLRGLQQVLDADAPDVHRMVLQAQAQDGSLLDLPWDRIVAAIVAWQPRRRRAPPPA